MCLSPTSPTGKQTIMKIVRKNNGYTLTVDHDRAGYSAELVAPDGGVSSARQQDSALATVRTALAELRAPCPDRVALWAYDCGRLFDSEKQNLSQAKRHARNVLRARHERTIFAPQPSAATPNSKP